MIFNNEEKIIGEDVTVEELLETISQDDFYYRRSGGGVTLSGGECLNQPDFAPHLLHACHDMGYSTAIETTGYQKWEIIEKYLEHLDYVLMDIKHMDSEKHKEFTGVSNELILENARKIAESGKVKLIIRTPVIPTFNHTPEEIRAIAEFAASLPGVEEHHLLPYHRLGQGKYDGLGRCYTMDGIEPMDTEYVNMLLEVAKKSGLKCQIGG